MDESYVVEAIIRAVDDGFQKNMKQNEESLNQFETKSARMASQVSTNMLGVGAGLTAGVTRPIVGMFKGAINSGAEFDAQMKMTQSVLGETAEEMRKLEEQALKIGSKGLFDASEVGSIQEELASAGFEVKDILDAAESAANIATLSESKDTGTAAKNLGVALNSFNLTAKDSKRVADVYVASTASTAAGVEDMGEAISYAASTAYNSNQTFEETAAAVGILADNGLYGSRAGTTLRNMMTSLANPSAKAKKAFDKLGISAFDAAGNMIPLNEIIGQIQKAQKDLTSEEMTRYISQGFGNQAAGGVLTLIREGQGRLVEVTKEMENAAGQAQEKADIVAEGTAASLKAMQNSMYTAQIEFLKAVEPVLVPTLQLITGLLTAFSSMDEGSQQLIASILAITAVVGPLIVALGTVMKFSAALKTFSAFTAVAGAGGAVATAGGGAVATGGLGISGLMALIPVWGWIALAIGGVVAVLAVLYNKNESFKLYVDNMWAGIKTAFSSGLDALGAGYGQVKNKFSETVGLFEEPIAELKQSTSELFDILGVASGFMLSVVGTRLQEDFGPTIDLLKGYFQSLGSAVGQFAEDSKIAAIEFGKRNGDGTLSMYNNLLVTISNIYVEIVNLFQGGMDDFFEIGGNIIEGLVDGFVRGKLNMIKTITNTINDIKGLFTLGFDIHSPSRYMEDMIGTNIILGLVRGITGNENLALNSMQGLANSMNAVEFGNNLPELDSDLTSKYDAYVKTDISDSLNNRQPAYINLGLGNREYDWFVEDITRTQDTKTSLQSTYI